MHTTLHCILYNSISTIQHRLEIRSANMYIVKCTDRHLILTYKFVANKMEIDNSEDVLKPRSVVMSANPIFIWHIVVGIPKT